MLTLGNLIKAFRQNSDLSQEQFAALCGLSKGYISMLENGKNPRTGKKLTPSLAVTKKAATAMGMQTSDVLAAIEPLDWTDTISKDEPTQDDLEAYESLESAPAPIPLWKEYFAQLRPYLKQMDEAQLKQLVRYAGFILQSEGDK